MRKALCALFVVLVVGNGAADCQGSRPNPKKSTPPKQVITAQEVWICVDATYKIRTADEFCTHPVDSCCYVRYLRNQPPWPAELPAVTEKLEDGRGWDAPLKPGDTPPNIPPEGAIFQR